ncbi:MAG: adenosine deaminase [Lachnospiraceae bacterium]|nr:adenosine deaminase [Lachnospiraceae bacterium]
MMDKAAIFTKSKTELHCHLDGSLPKQWMEQALGRELDSSLVSAPPDCSSLTEYLEKFELPLSCLQTALRLEDAAYALAADAARENVTYIEVRFAPNLHLDAGLHPDQAIKAVDRGLKRAETEYSIGYGIIVCAMRHHSMKENRTMLEHAGDLRAAGAANLAALDLAGDESAYPTSLFKELFDRAREMNMPFTIHSGETGSLENVKTAYEYGASRIGHGIALKQDPGLMRAFAEAGIGVEMCPTSNFQTKAVTSREEYPLPEFLEAGIPVSINTDNRTVSSTTLTRELELVYTQYGEDDSMLEQLLKNAEMMRFNPKL